MANSLERGCVGKVRGAVWRMRLSERDYQWSARCCTGPLVDCRVLRPMCGSRSTLAVLTVR